VQHAVFQVNELVPLTVGERLANKIDPASAELGYMTYRPDEDGSGAPPPLRDES
jgi:hypothetical protein